MTNPGGCAVSEVNCAMLRDEEKKIKLQTDEDGPAA
jgi:hypothetical protein